jgi:hypothetical protein
MPRLTASPMRLAALVLAAALLLAASATRAAAALPPVQHVWIIVLENKDYDDTFGPDTEAPFLARELTKSGQLLTNYFGTSHLSLGNYLTMVSGQAANPQTQADCQRFNDIFPGVTAPDGQVVGSGCVFPKDTKTIANQLEEAGKTWRGYMEDMGQPCRHPAIGDSDDTQSARKDDQYATRHNPFVYFHSIIDSPTCAKNVVPLSQLSKDIMSPSTTPNYAFVTPDLCNDGHDAECADGGPGGLPAADAFLKKWVPIILGSPGFSTSGLLVVTWDEANVDPDSSTACCDQPTGPNTPSPGIVGPGGGRTGSVLISPFIQPGSKNDTPYNHYGLLRSIEDLFGLGHLGYAAQPSLKAFGDDVFNAKPTGGAPKPPPVPSTACAAASRGRVVAGLRLRGRLLTFRARRSARIVIRAKHKRIRKRVKACRAYHLHVPKGTKTVRIHERGVKKQQRVKARAAQVHP